jgi:phosphoribosylformimino-5-aminoimidazole carboxamide ribotide isomerase
MLIIPAIDLKDGKCVRLTQGRMQDETVYSDDPVSVARRWAAAGAEWLHVVDLDAAVAGHTRNRDCIGRIVDAVGLPVQVGGGLRTAADVDACLSIGVRRAIIGTAATGDLAFLRDLCRRHPGRIAVGIDARNGRVATHGWTRTSDIEAVDLARRVEDAGVAAIIFTDIHRDGMQTGPNIDETRKIAEAVHLPVLASGGVGSLEHIKALLPLEAVGVVGVITGKALYSGAVEFTAARELAARRLDKPHYEN